MQKKEIIHALDIHISREEFITMTPQEREKWLNLILASMTPEQKEQMARIGARVIEDDILQRAEGRSRTALRTIARAVNVTVNEAETGGE